MAPNRRRVDSTEEMVQEMIAAATADIKPPATVELDETDMVFFNNIVEEFARSEWTAHQLELAAILARTMRDLVDEQAALRDEGSIAYSEKGTPVPNPRKTLIQMHAGTIFSMRRSLSLNATAKAGADARDLGRQRAHKKNAEANNPMEDGDDLIGRPASRPN